MGINDCNIITLPKVTDARGNLTFIENANHLPFDFRRVFYIYSVPVNGKRGAHAHRAQQQFIIALSGSFNVLLDDGNKRRTILLNKASEGLHIVPMVWGELDSFSEGAVCLVLVSDRYDESDYIRNYQKFLQVATGK